MGCYLGFRWMGFRIFPSGESARDRSPDGPTLPGGTCLSMCYLGGVTIRVGALPVWKRMLQEQPENKMSVLASVLTGVNFLHTFRGRSGAPAGVFLQLPLQGPPVHVQGPGSGGDIAIMFVQNPLNMLPLHFFHRGWFRAQFRHNFQQRLKT